uniref:Expressed protein n=1 Tax=Echinococcus granulosus TaxID=6210 RepID=A0A068WDZ7_ECHGR|nr:expressed protein [Echinococcus granulosus]
MEHNEVTHTRQAEEVSIQDRNIETLKDGQIRKSALDKAVDSLNSLGMAYEGFPCVESLNMEKKAYIYSAAKVRINQ